MKFKVKNCEHEVVITEIRRGNTCLCIKPGVPFEVSSEEAVILGRYFTPIQLEEVAGAAASKGKDAE